MIYTSVTNRNWKLKQFDLNQAQKLAQDHSLNEIQSRLLAIRNIKSEEVKDFLNPTLKKLHKSLKNVPLLKLRPLKEDSHL